MSKILKKTKKNAPQLVLIFAIGLVFFLCSCASTSLDLAFRTPTNKLSHIYYHPENIKLFGGEPAGGKYSGPGVEDGCFNPAIAGQGRHTITYSKLFHNSSTDIIEVWGPDYPPIEPPPPPKPLDPKIVSDQMQAFAPCLLEFERSEIHLLLKMKRWDLIDTLKPKISFYHVNRSGKLETVILPTNRVPNITEDLEEREVDKTSRPALLELVMPAKRKEIESTRPNLILLTVTYGEFEVKLYFDMRGFWDKNIELDDVRLSPSVLEVGGYFYRLPKGPFVVWTGLGEKAKLKEWTVMESCEGWSLQVNPAGLQRIADPEQKIALNGSAKSDLLNNWNNVKHQLGNGEQFWLGQTGKNYKTLLNALP